MGEARKVIFTFLILLFIIIGLGVLFSRAAKNKPEGPILGGIFDNIFFSRSTKVTPTPTPKSGSLSNAWLMVNSGTKDLVARVALSQILILFPQQGHQQLCSHSQA
jgi:hypothetical protein